MQKPELWSLTAAELTSTLSRRDNTLLAGCKAKPQLPEQMAGEMQN